MMIDRKSGIERRKKERFRINSAAYITLATPPTQKCIILDISLTGLAFRYFDGAQQIKCVDEVEKGKLDIFVASKDLLLNEIPFKTVYDSAIKNEMPLDSITLRKRGVRFGRLTKGQRSQLKDLVQNYTATTV